MLLYLAMMDDPEERSLFEEIYIKYRYLIYHIANKILQDSDAAEDAVHNTFIKLLNNMDKVDGVDSAKTKRFLTVTAKHTSIDLYRQRKLYMEYYGKEFADADIAVYETYEEDDAEGTINRVMECIKGMPDKYREVFLLKYSSGYSCSEIADILGISDVAVRQRIFRGKKILIDSLEKLGIKYFL